MISLGEMIAYLPIPGGHIKLAERFVDPAFSFTMVGSQPIPSAATTAETHDLVRAEAVAQPVCNPTAMVIGQRLDGGSQLD